MRHFAAVLPLIAALFSPKGFAAPAQTATAAVELHLITMGPGDHLYTRGGHAALEVIRRAPQGEAKSKVYNYGDTDWDNPNIPMEFLQGKLTFFVTDSGGLEKTVARYGMLQNRTIYRQRVNVPLETAQKIAAYLEEEIKPENRDYQYHHLEAICTTRVRDLIDRHIGGAIKKQLSAPNDRSVRWYGTWGFDGFPVLGLLSDMMIGRRHDAPVTKHYASFLPEKMREYLQTVKVPGPTGAPVPLVGKPSIVRERMGGPAITARQKSGPIFGAVFGAIVLLFGLAAVLRLGYRGRAIWTISYALFSGVYGLAMTVFLVASNVPEFYENELLMIYWPTDLLLITVGARWLRRGRIAISGALLLYIALKISASVMWLAGQLIGLLYQKPVTLALPGVFGVAILFALALRFRRSSR